MCYLLFWIKKWYFYIPSSSKEKNGTFIPLPPLKEINLGDVLSIVINKKMVWCLVCSFWPILKWVFCTFFSRVLPTKLFNFHWLKMDPKKTFFVRHTLGKNKINKSFKIDQKLHTKHHQIDQKTWKFDQFFDVWYVYFDQF